MTAITCEGRLGLRAVSLGQKAVPALFGYGEQCRIFGGLAKFGHRLIELKVVIRTESALDRGFYEATSEIIS